VRCASQAYKDIQHLRADNSEGDVILIAGVGEEHRASDILPDMTRAEGK
jgi:hypothetical protein